jgi:hypothetical protein
MIFLSFIYVGVRGFPGEFDGHGCIVDHC